MGTTHLETVPEPKYWHLKNVIGEALDSDFAVGEILPNERELAARFGVARATLRQALEQLELEGRLQRRRGVGTTVAPPRLGVDVSTNQHTGPGAAQDAWQAFDCDKVVPPPAVSRALGTAAGEETYALRRLRGTHGQPLAAELLYVPAASVPELTAIDAPSGAARARCVLRELQRLDLDGQDRAVELGSARADDARELDRLPGSPVLVVTTRYLCQGRTVAVSVATYRADTCKLTFGDSGDVRISHHGEERRAS
ncbi:MULTISPECIES: GntR family transcriptional regulator [Streptomyces]|uniref:GntR family transcriptional regulator n=1 Tax=Streptomyces tsukubensis (strain DSM 42081 / NBRC 108919 / NRRL 18488 / 9993) TaxID=1114943 RepID=I2MUR2_STRT9|nr:GntR family transcriptional regulator [Streptomyces tsukubensis]MYS67095.1 UTRA domain-containing protein [Streptomyces sp. SID5473]AZK93013.1 GntR family transcriptional regulator [Streptomyces tsukubensis]EIF88509.1 GntR family transcriptional regulator [Streptomyces tsukubensis NRRL18488]QKM70823.1 GntR family transcriptional regulator [Streptomyces tsukubensis NRRL18488]TAI41058.1 GntR family transcriptional regulator [Streptomyces tsukubensis]